MFSTVSTTLSSTLVFRHDNAKRVEVAGARPVSGLAELVLHHTADGVARQAVKHLDVARDHKVGEPVLEIGEELLGVELLTPSTNTTQALTSSGSSSDARGWFRTSDLSRVKRPVETPEEGRKPAFPCGMRHLPPMI